MVVTELIENLDISDIFKSKGRVKILKILALEGELNISEIARRAKLNYNSIRNHLNFLTKANVVQEKKFGRIRIYRFKIELLMVRAIKNLFDIWENPSLNHKLEVSPK
ncbi:MAG: ArsR/SmtB family transcription factor [Promethearchaeota archaeon]